MYTCQRLLENFHRSFSYISKSFHRRKQWRCFQHFSRHVFLLPWLLHFEYSRKFVHFSKIYIFVTGNSLDRKQKTIRNVFSHFEYKKICSLFKNPYLCYSKQEMIRNVFEHFSHFEYKKNGSLFKNLQIFLLLETGWVGGKNRRRRNLALLGDILKFRIRMRGLRIRYTRKLFKPGGIA